jgi:hypothetical protein
VLDQVGDGDAESGFGPPLLGDFGVAGREVVGPDVVADAGAELEMVPPLVERQIVHGADVGVPLLLRDQTRPVAPVDERLRQVVPILQQQIAQLPGQGPRVRVFLFGGGIVERARLVVRVGNDVKQLEVVAHPLPLRLDVIALPRNVCLAILEDYPQGFRVCDHLLAVAGIELPLVCRARIVVVLRIERLLARQPFLVFQEERAGALDREGVDQELRSFRLAIRIDHEWVRDALVAVGKEALQGVDVLLHRARNREVGAAEIDPVALLQLFELLAGERDQVVEIIAVAARALRLDRRRGDIVAVAAAGRRDSILSKIAMQTRLAGASLGVPAFEILVEAVVEPLEHGRAARQLWIGPIAFSNRSLSDQPLRR